MDVLMEGHVHVVRTLRAQNELLVVQNATLQAKNAELESERADMRKYCSSITDTAAQLLTRMEYEEKKSAHIADSLIMLWGQLATNGYVTGQLDPLTYGYHDMSPVSPSATPLSPSATIAGISAKFALAAPDSPSLTDLWCHETEIDACKQS